jgi:hypothetical protein
LNIRALAGVVDRATVPVFGAEAAPQSWGLSAKASGRRLWLFDSFEGMPEASRRDVGEDAQKLALGHSQRRLLPIGSNVASIQEVRNLLHRKLGLRDDAVVVRKGWFQHTKHETQAGNLGLTVIAR